MSYTRLDYETFKSLLREPEYSVELKRKRGKELVSVRWQGKQIFVKQRKDLTYQDYWHIRKWTWKWRNYRFNDIEKEADEELERYEKDREEKIRDFSKEGAKDLINALQERRWF